MTVGIRLSRARSTGWGRSTKAKPAIPHMLDGPRDRTRVAVDPAPHPELEAEHGPQPGRAIPTFRIVGAQEALDPGRIEDPALARAGVEQEIVGHVVELAPEPRAERHAEAHLAACEDLRGQAASHGALEDVLAHAAHQLQGAGDGGDELQQAMVEQRDAAL